MFTLAELAQDPTLLLDLKDDVRQECQRITEGGEVTNVVLYDKEEEGIMSVRFREAEHARKCVLVSRTARPPWTIGLTHLGATENEWPMVRLA